MGNGQLLPRLPPPSSGHAGLRWLEVIDEALTHLPAAPYTNLVAEAHQLVQDILDGWVPLERLLDVAEMPEED